MTQDEIWLALAIIADPNGNVCAFCQGPNKFADDCGFFYCHPLGGMNGYNGATCERCFKGEIGEMHQARYGVGER